MSWFRLGAPLGIQLRLALAIALTAVIPVASAVVLARSLVQQATERSFVPEIQDHLDDALQAYGELARQTKRAMRLEASLIAQQPAVRQAVLGSDSVEQKRALAQVLEHNPRLIGLSVLDANGEPLVSERRPSVSGLLELEVTVAVPRGEVLGAADELSPMLVATLGTPKAPFDEFERLGEFIEAYESLARRREVDEQTYVLAFAALLLGTIVIAVAVGGWLSRSISTRIGALAGAAMEAGRGDLSVRVAERPADEVGQLGRAFNQMLSEVEGSRARIEYLSRLASWQEMARRLAHEIKNPLTPIQLAVQEVHQRLRHLPADQREIVDVTLEIVEAEVLTLRRLVKEFSEFARLPQSERERSSLNKFLLELKHDFDMAPLQCMGLSGDTYPEVVLDWHIPSIEMPVKLDSQMMRRALINLFSNAVQACRGQSHARISLRVATNGRYRIEIQDNGPGIPSEVRQHLFEPYVTTKDDGTGLGLAIVKKIVMDHEGTIEAEERPSGGATFVLCLPKPPQES